MTWIFFGWMLSRLFVLDGDRMGPARGWTMDGTDAPSAQVMDGGSGQPPTVMDGGSGQPPTVMDGGSGQPPRF
jgi:hypothetical protein